MHPLLERLTNDHANFVRLLYCFRHQLNLLESEELNHEFDVNLMLDILDYINTYPNHWHHPIEDIMFDQLSNLTSEAEDVVSQLKAQHSDIEQLTLRLESEFQKVAMDSFVPLSELQKLGTRYLSLQIEHLETEEQQIFPLLDTVLTERDWQQVESTTEDIKDPLFGSQIEKVYSNLLDNIMDLDSDASQIQYFGY